MCFFACQLLLTFEIGSVRITEEDLERYMMTNLAGSPPLDVLIRSSGVKRLSDFLMWQVRFTTRDFACHVTQGMFLCRRRRTCSFILLLRIGRILGFGTFFRSFWIIRPRCGASRVKLLAKSLVELKSCVDYGVLTIGK